MPPRRQRKRKHEDGGACPKPEEEFVKKEEPVFDCQKEQAEISNPDPVFLFDSHVNFFRTETQGLINRMDETELDEFKMVGVMSYQRELSRFKSRSNRTTVVLERHVDNPYDRHAIAIMTISGDQLGSIAKAENRGSYMCRFYCPRLLASCTVKSWLDKSTQTHKYYGTVQCRAETEGMTVGCVAALPFEMPIDLIDRARSLSDRLDAAAHPKWIELKVSLLRASTESASRLNSDDEGFAPGDEFPRCCISGLPTDNVDPMWTFSDEKRVCVLENFVVVHKSMRHVLYPDPSEPGEDAIARLVLLNDKKVGGINEEEVRRLYRDTLDTCEARRKSGFRLTCLSLFSEFVEPHL